MAGPWERYAAPAAPTAPAGPWTKYASPAAPAPAAATEPPISTGLDIAESAASGLPRGLIETIMSPVTLARLTESGLGYVGEKSADLGAYLGLTPLTDEARKQIREPSALTKPLYDSQDKVRDYMNEKLHKPQTTAGKFAGTLTEFATPGGLPSKAARAAPGIAAKVGRYAEEALGNVVAPAVVSETAGQMTEGTPLEGPARFAGALAGNVGAAATRAHNAPESVIRRATEGTTEAQWAEAQRLQDNGMGIDLSSPEALSQARGGASKLTDLLRVVEGSTTGGNKTAPFFAKRPGQVDNAVGGVLDQIAPQSANPSMLGPRAAEAATNEIHHVRQGINEQTRPLYQAAEPQQVPQSKLSDFPVTGYHGTNDVISKFDPEQTRLGRGVFFSTKPDLANRFAMGQATDSDAFRNPYDDPNDFMPFIREMLGDAEANSIKGDVAAMQAGQASGDQMRKVNDAAARATAFIDPETYAPTKTPNVSAAQIKPGKVYEADLGDRFDWDKEAAAIAAAKAGGYDTVHFKLSGAKGAEDFYSVLNTGNIVEGYGMKGRAGPVPADHPARQPFDAIGEDPSFKAAVKRLRDDPELGPGYAHLPDNSVGVIDAVTKDLTARSDALGNKANPLYGPELAARNQSVAEKARSVATQQSPEYAQALAEQERLRRTVLEPVKNGPVGRVAAAQDTATAGNAILPQNPLSGSGPEAADAVQRLVRQDPETTAALVRQNLADRYSAAQTETQGGSREAAGAKFHKSVAGNDQRQQVLDAVVRALPTGPTAAPALSNLMEILQATMRREGPGSATESNRMITSELGATSPVGKLVDIAKSLGSSFITQAGDATKRAQLRNNLGDLAGTLTGPNAVQRTRAAADRRPQVSYPESVLRTLLESGQTLQDPRGNR